MKATSSPDYAPNYLVIDVGACDTVDLTKGAVVVDQSIELGSVMSLSIQSLSGYCEEGQSEQAALQADGLAIARFYKREGGDNLSIYLPERWIPRIYFTKIPIPTERIRGHKPIEIPLNGLLVHFDRSLQPETIYDLFPRPMAQDVK